MISYKPLERLLRDRGISLQELSDKLGFSRQALYVGLNVSETRTNFVERICNALNCDIQDVIEYSEEEVSLDKVEVDWDKLTDKAKMSGYNFVSLAEELGYSRCFFLTAKCKKRKLKITIVEDICSLLNCTEQDIV
jgi:DNA-binding Xre family transcriptional regulator